MERAILIDMRVRLVNGHATTDLDSSELKDRNYRLSYENPSGKTICAEGLDRIGVYRKVAQVRTRQPDSLILLFYSEAENSREEAKWHR